ncbi:MAG: hypothetical protein QOI12_2144 [Alphaproteobacteria bacterium]|jgi:hypothetical protein|nr:hypothetical protein [Alphaproteobacteria bacterium]
MAHTAILVAALTLALAAQPTAPAQALTTRTFVSATGTDSGTCGRPTPCRTLQFAHDQTSANGEIGILDSAGYGPLTITKSISIVNPGGVEAGILAAPGGTAVTINAGATDKVSLRGLTLEGANSGQYGIGVNSGGKLTIVDCVVRNFGLFGIWLPTTSATRFFIANTLVADNGSIGIFIVPGETGTAGGAIDHVAATGNGTGIYVEGSSTTGSTLNVTISNSVMHGNDYGILSYTYGGYAVTNVTVVNSSASSNGTGFVADGISTMRLSANVATANGIGVFKAAGATVHTAGNNYFRGNGTDVSGALTTTETLQ